MSNGATEKQLNDLSAPIPRKYIKTDSRKGNTIYYVTARTVMNRLDEAVGRANWRTEYRVIFPGPEQSTGHPMTVECTLYIRINGEWVGKADVATDSNYSPEKAAYSNALKRAGANWGIARELYGEGNVYEEDTDSPNAADEPARVFDFNQAPFAQDQGVFNGEKCKAMSVYMTQNKLADNDYHAAKRILKAINRTELNAHAEAGGHPDTWQDMTWQEVYDEHFPAFEVWGKVEDYMQAQEG